MQHLVRFGGLQNRDTRGLQSNSSSRVCTEQLFGEDVCLQLPSNQPPCHISEPVHKKFRLRAHLSLPSVRLNPFPFVQSPSPAFSLASFGYRRAALRCCHEVASLAGKAGGRGAVGVSWHVVEPAAEQKCCSPSPVSWQQGAKDQRIPGSCWLGPPLQQAGAPKGQAVGRGVL